MGAWIEIQLRTEIQRKSWSLPPWERGLKSHVITSHVHTGYVAPPVGAWIEIRPIKNSMSLVSVAPPVGAWIEIDKTSLKNVKGKGRSPRGSVD